MPSINQNLNLFKLIRSTLIMDRMPMHTSDPLEQKIHRTHVSQQYIEINIKRLLYHLSRYNHRLGGATTVLNSGVFAINTPEPILLPSTIGGHITRMDKINQIPILEERIILYFIKRPLGFADSIADYKSITTIFQ